jgi:CubicO group peptidase (beta-lactamase class C family)
MNERESSAVEQVIATGFEPVAAAFADVLQHSAAGGAAVTVIVDGVTVIDLWGGQADVRSVDGRPPEPWVDTTTSVVFSMTKGLLALLVARLVEEGSVDLDAPVAQYWPEFAQEGKAAITVRDVMSHRAGLSYPIEDITREDILRWTPVIEKLQAQRPSWEPGTTHVYHALTYGWLVGEVVRRVTGLGVDAAFERYLAAPAGARFWVGLPADELPHVSHLVPGPGFHFALPAEIPFAEQIVRALTLGGAFPDYVAGDGTGLNDPALQQAVVPAGLGIGTSRAVATLWSAALLGMPGVDPLDPATLDDMTVSRSSGEPAWALPGLPWEAWGTGFHVPSEAMPMLGPTSFGHGGAGGQLSFADREHRLAFAFVTNDLQAFDDHRVESLLAALRESLGR